MQERERRAFLILGIILMHEDQRVLDMFNCKHQRSHQALEGVGSMNLEEVGGWREEGRGHG